MKKFGSIVLTVACVAALTACGSQAEEVVNEATEVIEEAVEEVTEAAEEVAEEATEEVEEAAEEVEGVGDIVQNLFDYASFVAADLDTEVELVTYVQAHQSWWDNTITLYTQTPEGGFFVYGAACTEEDAAKLVPGTKVYVKGFKSEWSGEVEIVDATLEIIDDGDTFIAEATDVTDKLGTDELADYMNQFVSFTDMTVEASKDADGNEVAYLYNWDGSGSQGDDLYFNVSKDGQTYNFTVESYLCGADTDVYKAVEDLNVGDTVDLEGFLYWYEGANPHITSCTVK